jgi:hypothetical protein
MYPTWGLPRRAPHTGNSNARLTSQATSSACVQAATALSAQQYTNMAALELPAHTTRHPRLPAHTAQVRLAGSTHLLLEQLPAAPTLR